MKHFGKIFILASLLFLVSCKKEDSNEALLSTTENIANVDDLIEDTDILADDLANQRDAQTDCPTITADAPKGVFPVNVTIDFGTDGCVGKDGRVRTGKIIVYRSDSMHVAGSTRTVTMDGFTVDDVSIEGSRTWVNNGPDANGNPSWSVSTTGGEMNFPDGSSITFQGAHTFVMIEGAGSKIRIDDVLSITGNASGTNKKGISWSAQITEPLIKRFSCPWITAGVREVTVDNETYTIDYGDGDCDRKALLTRPDGTTKTIILRGK